jgi:hypothetical protein
VILPASLARLWFSQTGIFPGAPKESLTHVKFRVTRMPRRIGGEPDINVNHALNR